MSNIIDLNTPEISLKREYNKRVKEVMDGFHPRIPAGQYESVMTGWYTANILGTPKVVLLFTIIDFGEYQNVIVPRFYAVKRLTSKQGLNGTFIAKPRGAFSDDYFKMRPTAPKLRKDQIPMTTLQNKPMLITVGDVTHSSDKKKEHLEQQIYSVVREVRLL